MVDARQLHAALRVGTLFALWIKRRIRSEGFVEDRDYVEDILFKSEKKSREGDSKRGSGQPSTEYALSVETAKHPDIGGRTGVGRAIRAHFIQCEEAMRTGDSEAYAGSMERMRDDIHRGAGMEGTGAHGLVTRELVIGTTSGCGD